MSATFTSATAIHMHSSYPRSAEEEEQTKNVWLKGHTGSILNYSVSSSTYTSLPDIGSITILWSQPISGLQILSQDGVWRYIRHIENALVGGESSVITVADKRSPVGCEHR